MTIDEYNDNLKAMDMARAYHRPQPKGLANYAVMKKAKENSMFAPFTIEKSPYYNEYIVKNGAAVCGTYRTKKEATAWIMSEKGM